MSIVVMSRGISSLIQAIIIYYVVLKTKDNFPVLLTQQVFLFSILVLKTKCLDKVITVICFFCF